MPQNLASMTLTSNDGANSYNINATAISDSATSPHPITAGPTIYERIATGMRSKAMRDEVKFTLKEGPTANLNAKVQSKTPTARGGIGSSSISMQKGGSGTGAQAPKMRMDTRALQKMAAKRVLPSGHEVWGKRPSNEEGPT